MNEKSPYSALKMVAVCFSKTLIFAYKATRVATQMNVHTFTTLRT
jgi:hypothetical protein